VFLRCLKVWLSISGLLLYCLPGHAFQYEDLVDLIQKKDFATIEQVLPHLPPEYLENYTLAYDSRSLHGSSHDFPRAILFGNDAKLIVTFNGSPEQRRYRDMEIMQFREDSRVFELRSISFADGVRFSDKNPTLCLKCHGASPRPLWSSYEYSEDNSLRHWPGFYGSTHDAPVLNPEEKDAFLLFRALARDHPRYRFLRFIHGGSQWYPYGPGPFKHQFRPNNRLGNLLARLNAKRVARNVRENAFLQTYPNLSFLWILQCPEISDHSYARFIAHQYRGDVLPETITTDLLDATGQAAFVFEKLLSGPDVYTWNLSPEASADEPRFFTGMVSIDELVAAELMSSMPAGHWLREYYVPWTQRELYDTFKQGYYAENVAPGGVGTAYGATGPFYDREHAKGACPDLNRYARAEVVNLSLAR
jgi:hypothetical protein